MAIAIHPKFPIPDRTKRPILFTKDQDGVIDVGWCEGVLSDGRAFRAEMWAQDQVSSLTFFFSTFGLEDLDQEAMKRLVEHEGLVSFRSGPSYCAAAKYIDCAGNQVWSVNIVVGDEDQTYIDNSVPIFPYPRDGEPNTMFNPVPIKAAHRISAHKPTKEELENARDRFTWKDHTLLSTRPTKRAKLSLKRSPTSNHLHRHTLPAVFLFSKIRPIDKYKQTIELLSNRVHR